MMLKNTLIMNASSCLIFGLLFVVMASEVNLFLGNTISWLTPFIGVALIFNGCHLIFASKRIKPICPEILYFITGDLAWVIATIVFIIFGVVVTSIAGVIVASLVALMVATFAVLQVVGYKKSCIKQTTIT